MDLSRFDRTECYKALQVAPKSVQLVRTTACLQPVLLKIPRISNVRDSKHKDGEGRLLKCVLLKQGVKEEEVAAALEFLGSQGLKHVGVEECEIDLGYAHMTAEEALKAILPPQDQDGDIPIPTSFETVGHIAHFNLKPAHEPYKKEIGQITLDKNPHLRTVVNKVGTLNNEFRTFTMEVIAGEDCTDAVVKERGRTFKFDFRKVYWNGRLCMERERLLGTMDAQHDVLVDAFAGIGALAIFAAADKGLRFVYANDLNPHSASAMRENVRTNKVDQRVRVDNEDARAYLRALFKERPWAGEQQLEEEEEKEEGKDERKRNKDARAGAGADYSPTVHIVMNLPELALDFCDVFADIISELKDRVRVHCHCFARLEPPMEEIYPRLQRALGEAYMSTALPRKFIDIVDVRDVAPNKHMYCVEFTLHPLDIDHNDKKRRKMDDEKRIG